MIDIDYEALSGELIRHIRAHRSQVAFSRRLKYRSNVAYLWESGRNWPTAAVFLWAAQRAGTDVHEAASRFYREPPSWLDFRERPCKEMIARMLDDLRGNTPILELAGRMRRSRFAVSRWLKGETEPRLPDFLRLIEASTSRLLDFIAEFADPAELPSVHEAWKQLRAARTMVGRLPWSPAVLLLLQTEAYKNTKKHQHGWIAHRLGVPIDVEDECMALLASSGQITRSKGLWKVVRVQAIDTRSDPDAGKKLRRWWAQVGMDRMHDTPEGLFSYNVFSISKADLERLRQMHRAYYRAMRALISASEPTERVVVANVQLFPLDR